MIDFNNEIPKGKPQIPSDYLKQNKVKEEQQQIPNAIFDLNTNVALKDISIFKGKK